MPVYVVFFSFLRFIVYRVPQRNWNVVIRSKVQSNSEARTITTINYNILNCRLWERVPRCRSFDFYLCIRLNIRMRLPRRFRSSCIQFGSRVYFPLNQNVSQFDIWMLCSDSFSVSLLYDEQFIIIILLNSCFAHKHTSIMAMISEGDTLLNTILLNRHRL